MSGISSKAESTLQNNKKYNGIEFDEDLGLNIYEAFYRHLDPQTGRWWEIDPKIEWEMENWSPYNSNFNNPIIYSDPKGDCPLCIIPILIGLLTTSTPANPPSSLPIQNRTEAATKSWENAVHNRDVQIVGALLTGGAKVIANAIDNTYNKVEESVQKNNTQESKAKEPELRVKEIGKTKTGETRVKAERGETRLDITNDRVKEYVKEPRNPKTGERQVNFKKEGLPDNSQIIPGSKGLKRTPTPSEQKILETSKVKTNP
ncbi:MAG: hypothetical protein KGZ59_03920 [Chitinophagaceae bacterium]|nr:hypothetical protein [Chitinophagaceae bacterium]